MSEEKQEFWENRVKYLKGVSGEHIEKEYNKFNNLDYAFIVATQTHLKSDGTYDCFIYYKMNPKRLKELFEEIKPLIKL